MRERIRLWWYNNFLRHYHNWKVHRMWLADPNAPKICPRAGRITPEAIAWAKSRMKELNG